MSANIMGMGRPKASGHGTGGRRGPHFLTAEPRRSRRKKWPLSTNSWWMGSHRTWLRNPYLRHSAITHDRYLLSLPPDRHATAGMLCLRLQVYARQYRCMLVKLWLDRLCAGDNGAG